MKFALLILAIAFFADASYAQFNASIPWSSSLNVTFGNGPSSIGPPLTSAYTDFPYTDESSPYPGSYSIVHSTNDAGHVYYGAFPIANFTEGYKMAVSYNSAFTPKIIFGDTVNNLCGKTRYLLWVGINNINAASCLVPELSLNVETLSGQVIASFQTGKIGGALSEDNYGWYYGFYDPTKKPAVPFYGGTFELPAGITDVVVKIITNPTAAFYQCSASLQLDNIILMPVGPELNIYSEKYAGGWIAASCFQGDVPLELFTKIDSAYAAFPKPGRISYQYDNPAFQWQQSLDDGYTWLDIQGENQPAISHIFNNPDTFWIRLRSSEAGYINNTNCSNVSNVLKIQVDGLPTDFSFSSNSPVCTDGDIKLELSGGVTYYTYGPNGFFDDSPFPHVYHPTHANDGWYYSEIKSFGGCKMLDSVFVKVIGPQITVSTDKTICYGDTVHLKATGGIKYVWTPTAGLNDTGSAIPVASPVATTKYEVKVTDETGCSALGSTIINLKDSVLKAGFNNPDVVCPGDAVLFRDSSQGQITSWQWDFGNGVTSNNRNPPEQHYSMMNNAFIPVRLTITDTAACTQSTEKIIQVVNNCFIAVPNAFTPNNDGLNDFLYPLNAYKTSHLIFKIYNRQGLVMFQTKDWTKKWDGTLHGDPQPPGTYVWVLSYTDEKQKPVSLKGSVVLIR